jgi:hypothetical protein
LFRALSSGVETEVVMPLIYLPWALFSATVSLLFDSPPDRK